VLNYNHLFYFHVAASEGSVARAAERLHVTQPTVSEQIRQLERTLGVTLFERTRSGMRLTDAGRRAFEHSSVMFRAGERLVDSLAADDEPREATVRVGVSWSASRSIAPDFFFPLLELEGCVVSVQRAELVDLLPGLRNRRLDVVLGEAAPAHASRDRLHVVDVYRPRLIGIAGGSVRPSRTWAEIHLIHHEVGSVHRAEVDGYLNEHGLHPKVVATTDDASLMLACATRGACVAFVPHSLARPAVEAGTVRVVATLEPSPLTVHAVHHNPAPEVVRRAVKVLVDRAAAAG
jgi:LysR family transcriptional regulator, transcriptional activator of nhaA